MPDVIPTTEERMHQFFTEHPRPVEQAFLAEWTGSARTTLLSWQTNAMPKGERLLRLRCFLHLAEYSPREFEALQPAARSLALLIFLKAYTPKEVAQLLEYTDDHGVYRLLLQGDSVMPERAHKLEQVIRSHRTDIEQGVVGWKELYAQVCQVTGSTGSASDAALPPPPDTPRGVIGSGRADLSHSHPAGDGPPYSSPVDLVADVAAAKAGGAPASGPTSSVFRQEADGQEVLDTEAVFGPSPVNDTFNAMLIADITPAAIQTLQSLLDAAAFLPVSGLVKKQVLRQLNGPDAVISLIESLQDLIE